MRKARKQYEPKGMRNLEKTRDPIRAFKYRMAKQHKAILKIIRQAKKRIRR